MTYYILLNLTRSLFQFSSTARTNKPYSVPVSKTALDYRSQCTGQSRATRGVGGTQAHEEIHRQWSGATKQESDWFG